MATENIKYLSNKRKQFLDTFNVEMLLHPIYMSLVHQNDMTTLSKISFFHKTYQGLKLEHALHFLEHINVKDVESHSNFISTVS